MYYKGEVIVGANIGVIFYSNKIAQVFTEIDEILFDGTFYTAFNFTNFGQFFCRIGRHRRSIPNYFTEFMNTCHNCHPLTECQIGKRVLEIQFLQYTLEFIFIIIDVNFTLHKIYLEKGTKTGFATLYDNNDELNAWFEL